MHPIVRILLNGQKVEADLRLVSIEQRPGEIMVISLQSAELSAKPSERTIAITEHVP